MVVALDLADPTGADLSANRGGMVLSYNGVYFHSYVSHKIRARPEYTADSRGVKWVEYTVTVEADVGSANQPADDTTDGSLSEMRQRLLKPAGELHLEDQGFGGLVIDVPAAGPEVGSSGKLKDAWWGPKPNLLTFEGYGVPCFAAHVTWEVVVRVGECPDAPDEFGLVEWCTEHSWTPSSSGRTVREITGHVTIAQTRLTVESTLLRYSADRLRERVVAAVPLVNGSRRTFGPFKLSMDRNTLSFTIRDEEEGGSGDNYPPRGIVQVSASQTVTVEGPVGGKANSTLRASYQVARDVPRGYPQLCFGALFADRFRQAGVVPFQRPRGGAATPQVGIITSFTASEPEIYSKEGSADASFQISWRLLARLDDVVKASGLWRKLPAAAGGDWQAWATSLSNTAFHPRGNRKLAFAPTEGVDAIVDLCHQGTARTISASGGPPQSRGSGDSSRLFTNSLPPEDSSWIYWISTITIEQQDETLPLKTLPITPPFKPDRPAPQPNLQPGGPTFTSSAPPDQIGLGPVPGKDASVGSRQMDFMGAYNSPGASAASGSATTARAAPPAAAAGGAGGLVIQVASQPTSVVTLRGSALRAGYLIGPPAVLSVGGQLAVPYNRIGVNYFTHAIIAQYFGLAVVRADWCISYVLTGIPSGLPIMDTPLL